MITDKDVIWAYRLFLGREPEGREVIASKLLHLETREELRSHFMNCQEFQFVNRDLDTEAEASGLPVPPDELIELVADDKEVLWFLRGGKKAAESIVSSLARVGLNLEDFESVLDFGCGCGRVVRYWKDLDGPAIYGSDFNSKLIEWCQENLRFAKFTVNGLEPPLEYPDDFFDFIYALSVFTHLTEELQDAWVVELARVLRPGGSPFADGAREPLPRPTLGRATGSLSAGRHGRDRGRRPRLESIRRLTTRCHTC